MYPAAVEGVTARHITTQAGERVRVAESGVGNTQVALLLHGWGCSVYSFRHLFAPLAARGLHVIAPDLRGHGLSDKPLHAAAYTLDAMVAHVMQIVSALQLENPVIQWADVSPLKLRCAIRTSPDRSCW
jgi:pimeloyl-ACP methyl ester carboxylesterase